MYEGDDDQARDGRGSRGRSTPLVRRTYARADGRRDSSGSRDARADAYDGPAYDGGGYDDYDGPAYDGGGYVAYDSRAYDGGGYDDYDSRAFRDYDGDARQSYPDDPAYDDYPGGAQGYDLYDEPQGGDVRGARDARRAPHGQVRRGSRGSRPSNLLSGLSTPRLAAGLALLVALVALLVYLVPQFTRGGVTDTADVAKQEVVSSADDQASTGPSSSQASGNLSGTPSYSVVREAVAQAAAPYGDHLAVVYLPLDDPYSGCDVNGDVQMQSASMIKTAVLATVLQQAEDGTISLSDSYTVQGDDVVGGTGSLQGAVGQTFTYDELAGRMIYESDNVATNVLIGVVGMDGVNAECESLGLSGTHLGHLMMSTGDGGKANTTTAEDQAKIFQLIANGELVSEEQSARALSYLKEQEDDEGIVAGVPEGTVVANKTGSLDIVRHDGGIVYATHPYVLVVMTQGLGEGRANQAMAAISKAAWDASVQVGAA